MKRLSYFMLACALLVLSSGCISAKYSKTVGLPGLAPISNVDDVKVVEKFEEVKQPYQIVGQVTCYQGGALKGTLLKRMKEVAASMGADGLIGFYTANVLAVKWLAPGQPKQPLAVPFVVALLPIPQDPKAKGNQSKITAAAYIAAGYQLGTKGYFAFPFVATQFTGGLEAAQSLGEAELQALVSEDAQFLLEFSFQSRDEANYVLAKTATATLKARLMDKRTRAIIFDSSASGKKEVGGADLVLGGPALFWLAEAISPNEKRIAAACEAVCQVLSTLGDISEKVP